MREIKIIIGFLVVASFEIAFHWFLSTPHKLAQSLLHFYIYRFPNNGKGIFGIIDIFLPSIALGLLIGWVGWQWSLLKRFVFVVAAALALLALMSVYRLLPSGDVMWWWPKSSSEYVDIFITAFLEAFVLAGVFSYWSRCAGLRFYEKQCSHAA